MSNPTLAALLFVFLNILCVRSLPTAGLRELSSNVFSCDTSNALMNAICKAGLQEVNSKLQSLGIFIDRNDDLFTLDDGTNRKIPTGHSCSVTAEVQHQHVSANTRSSSRLSLSAKSITEPFALRLQVPVDLRARIDVKQRFGARVLGKCVRIGSDSYSLKASLSTRADLLIALTLNPSVGELPSGDYALILEPRIIVMSALENTSLKFHASGVSPITPIVTFVAGLGSTKLKLITALFTGESMSEIAKGGLVDIGLSFILGVGRLPTSIEQKIWSLLLKNRFERAAEKKAKGFGSDLESKLYSKLQQTLKLDRNGKRTFVVKQDIVTLLQSGASGLSDLPPDPSVACFQRNSGFCSSCRGCSECGRRMAECQRIRNEHASKYKPTKIIPSKPKVANL